MDQTLPPCQICGNSNFTSNEGYYFCLECGTQAANVQEIELEYQENRHEVSRRIKTIKATERELTTWEAFNYLICGLVEELINLGAKDELKLKTLQLWSAYLRKQEVAFFNHKHVQLPKLGASFNRRDAKILYNHRVMQAKKKIKKEFSMSNTGEATIHDMKRAKRNYVKSEYELLSASLSLSNTDHSRSSFNTSRLSSSSAATCKVARLTFTDSARKILKKYMSKNHLKHHEFDADKILKCHQLPIRKSVLSKKMVRQQLSCITVYSILYLALNLINDDIQLSDMLRFIREKHLSSTKYLHLFPENIASSCERIIISQGCAAKRNIFCDRTIRLNAATLCNYITINELNIPNLKKLCLRYCKEFLLPKEFYQYIERLINFSPPEMKLTPEIQCIPYYECRAMAYIIFIFKLLFGLDDKKENLISESAKEINEMFVKLNKSRRLFVWAEWLKYIEMRKIIFNQTFKSNEYYFQEILNEDKTTEEDITKHNRTQLQYLKRIFEKFLHDNDNKNDIGILQLPTTLTPSIDYFNVILNGSFSKFEIPDFMLNDQSSSEIHPFLKPRDLQIDLRKENINLYIEELKCNEDKDYFEIFTYKSPHETEIQITLRKAEYDISEDEWTEEVKKKAKFDVFDDFLKPTYKPESTNEEQENELSNAMLPEISSYVAENDFNPKRDNDNINIFGELSDDDYSSCEIDSKDTLKFLVSKLDYWTIFGNMLKVHEENFSNIKNNFPRNFLWILETFSDYLGINSEYLYRELLILENHFLYVLDLDSIDQFKNILMLQNIDKSKLGRVNNQYKRFW